MHINVTIPEFKMCVTEGNVENRFIIEIYSGKAAHISLKDTTSARVQDLNTITASPARVS